MEETGLVNDVQGVPTINEDVAVNRKRRNGIDSDQLLAELPGIV